MPSRSFQFGSSMKSEQLRSLSYLYFLGLEVRSNGSCFDHLAIIVPANLFICYAIVIYELLERHVSMPIK